MTKLIYVVIIFVSFVSFGCFHLLKKLDIFLRNLFCYNSRFGLPGPFRTTVMLYDVFTYQYTPLLKSHFIIELRSGGYFGNIMNQNLEPTWVKIDIKDECILGNKQGSF